ncbi:MAG TPA: biopolymer transporter ExbD [Gemmatimonadaceae bacterium]|nr:biopolymer transporter ExbD [Gemmatimonadaceae bacterium]
MASVYLRAKQRRVERRSLTDAGNINLVPLVDILTAVVFFGLLTYQGAALAALTAFELSLPPVVITAQQAATAAPQREALNLLLAVRLERDGILVEHTGEGGFRKEIAGVQGASLDTLQTVMSEIRRQYPQNADVLVVPADDVAYDDLIHVLERLRVAAYSGISLGNRTRATQVAAIDGQPVGGVR